MTADVVGLYNAILNITKELVGRKVVRRENDQEDKVGTIVAVGLGDRGRLWVVWPHTNGEPTPHHARELLALKEDSLEKSLKWHGKTLIGLENFLKQVRAEGGDDNTELNPNSEAHVAIRVSLPLATPKVYNPEHPKHDHSFNEPCLKGCPAHGHVFPRPVRDEPQA